MTRAQSINQAVRVVAILALGVFGAAGCKPKAANADQTPGDAVHVETLDVREAPMPKSLALTGSLRGKRQTDLAANANGRVMETFVERGSEVKKGDLLAKLDVRAAAITAAEAQANVALAKAQEATAKRECDRYKALLDKHAITQSEYDHAADQCQTSPLSVVAAEDRARGAAQTVGDGTIRAPFGGIVTERFVEAGAYVHQDTRIVSLVAVDTLKLEFTVPEANLGSVNEGGALSFTVPAYPDRAFSGTVRYVGAAVRETTRDLVAEAVVDNTDRALKPGMFATVALVTGEAPMLVLPKSAILEKNGLGFVYAVVDRRLEERVVQTGAAKGDLVGIERGVKAGDKIVAKPTEALHNGQAVN